MLSRTEKLVLGFALVLLGVFLIGRHIRVEKLTPIQDVVTEKQGWLPSHQGPYFQNLGPSVVMENNYHANVHNDCGGNYADLKCRQKAYIKAVKNGTTDKADLMCWRFRDDEDQYYQCLDGIYGNYIWMDRFTGAQPCLCTGEGTWPGQGQGASSADGSCYCPKPRPMSQRWGLDQNGEIVDRLQ